ncbi:SDR family NAD(P)-dependent oxidoreductase [Yinghuangia aomiensis]|uniref:SDR family NAD(P)-dependent oxidoreductase n=1 Tax=Yinghuangia aomiensis TaxID=676205 RepID=A0ABP9I4E6_9ACTN
MALVTGGSSGIGRAVVADLLAHDHEVVVLDRRAPDDGADALGGATLVLGDVTSPDDNRRAVETAVERHGALHLLVANAGIHDGGARLADRSAEDLAALTRRVLDVDVVGYVLAAKAASEALTASHGAMVFTLSDASFHVSPEMGAGIAYAAAKHAALGVVRHLAGDLAPHVRVNAVAPGGILTDLREADGTGVFAEDPDGIREATRDLNPLRVVLTPEQIAPLYRFLASDAACGMTGEILRPDGGLSVR